MAVRPVRARESVPVGDPRIDTEAAVVYGVKVLGFTSQNGREYPRAVCEAAAPLYDGAIVRLDHGGRSVLSTFGRIHGPTVRDDGLYAAELRYNPGHAFAKAFEWAVRHDPRSIGLSHDALVRYTDASQTTAAEIVRVLSVDLVSSPATTAGVFENVMDESALTLDSPGDASAAADAAPADTADAIGKLVLSIINDDELDAAAKRKKVLAALKLLDDEGDAPADTGDAPADSAPAAESLAREVADLRAIVDAFRTRERLAAETERNRERCRTAGLPAAAVSDVFLSTLVGRTAEDVNRLIADRRTITLAGRVASPVSAVPTNTGDRMTLDAFVSAALTGK
jgi:hypothetical protein